MFSGLRNIDELLTLAGSIKVGSVDDHFRESIRNIIEYYYTADRPKETIIKYTQEDIHKMIDREVPSFRQQHLKTTLASVINEEFDKLCKRDLRNENK